MRLVRSRPTRSGRDRRQRGDPVRAVHGPRAVRRARGSTCEPTVGAGRRGDFLTSPEVGPLFGAVVARYLDAEWERLGRPDPFTVVEPAPGPGTLARTVLAARPACRDALTYVAVEVSAAQRATPSRRRRVACRPAGRPDRRRRARQRAARQPAVPAGRVRRRLARGVRRRRPSRSVRRGAVGRRSTRCRRVLPAPPIAAPGLRSRGGRGVRGVDAALGRRTPARGLHRLRARRARRELAMRPWREWLRTYRGHERGGHYLADAGRPGHHHRHPARPTPASRTLVRRRPSSCSAGASTNSSPKAGGCGPSGRRGPGLDAMRMRSRVAESEALLDPAGLGAFLVAEWRATARDRGQRMSEATRR